MASFSIKESEINNVAASMEDLRRELSQIQAETLKIANNLYINSAAATLLRTKLKKISDKSLKKEELNMGRMLQSLRLIIGQYDRAENRVTGKSNVTNQNAEIQHNSINILKEYLNSAIIYKSKMYNPFVMVISPVVPPRKSRVPRNVLIKVIAKSIVDTADTIADTIDESEIVMRDSGGSVGNQNTQDLASTDQNSSGAKTPAQVSVMNEEEILKEMGERKERMPRYVKDGTWTSQKGKVYRDVSGYHRNCSLYVHDQLTDLGIIPNDETWTSGYAYADYLIKKGTTQTGYQCTGYYGEHAFDDLINKNVDNMPITNIVVSIKGSDVENCVSSSKEGHAMLITRIQDGKVYFMDSLCYNIGGTQITDGHPTCLPYDMFKKMYFGSNECSGIAHFYK